MSALVANQYAGKILIAKSSSSSSKSSSSHSGSSKSSSSKSGSSNTHTGTSTSYRNGTSHHSGTGSFLGGILVLALLAAVAVVGVVFWRRRRNSGPTSTPHPGFAPGGGPVGQSAGYGKNF